MTGQNVVYWRDEMVVGSGWLSTVFGVGERVGLTRVTIAFAHRPRAHARPLIPWVFAAYQLKGLGSRLTRHVDHRGLSVRVTVLWKRETALQTRPLDQITYHTRSLDGLSLPTEALVDPLRFLF